MRFPAYINYKTLIMQKLGLIVCFCFAALFVSGQQNEYGHISGDTLILNTGARFVKGEKIRLGYGANGAKGFEFIYLSPMSIAGPLKLTSNWANTTMVIKRFELHGTKRLGKKFYIILGGGNLSPYWCDIVAAIEQREIFAPGINDKVGTSAITQSSVTDELKKLKDLYDSGALTKEEYEAAKKKILDKM
jgi:hypothetical protein